MTKLEADMHRIEAYCSHLERLAWLIPPPNKVTPEIMSTAISLRNIAVEWLAEIERAENPSRHMEPRQLYDATR